MASFKRVAVFLLLALCVMVVSAGYKGNDVLSRAVVLGLGVDYAPEGMCVTAEVVSPGNGSEEVGTYSKTVSAVGATVAEALQAISQKTGKETSLGQCVLLVYGQQFVQQNFASTAQFFALSDSFKESAMVCCCEGTAQQLLNCGDALLQSVSISLAEKLKGQAREMALPSRNLLAFSRSQQELSCTGFLNYVTWQTSQNTNQQNPDQPQVYFDYSQIALFSNYQCLGLLSPQQAQGFGLLCNEVTGSVFVVNTQQNLVLTLRSNTKEVDISLGQQGVQINLKVFVTMARTDSFGAGGKGGAKEEKQLSEHCLQQVKQQAQQQTQDFLQLQATLGADLLGFCELYRQKYGSGVLLSVQDVPVTVHIEVEEN